MSTINELIDGARLGFLQVGKNKPQQVTWEEESRFALQAVSNNTYLQECDQNTIQDAIRNIAAIGLTLNPAHGYAYLVPDSIKVGSNWKKVCQLRVSFKGLIKLANDSGVAKWVRADVVKENDTFTFNGAWELPVHQMDPFGERGKSIGVYCTIKTKDGEYLTEVAPWSEVEKAKEAAKTNNVWEKWPDEMAKKFIIKRASKQWPKGDGFEHMAEAINIINEYEGSDDIQKGRNGPMALIADEAKAQLSEKALAAAQDAADKIDEMFTAEPAGGGQRATLVVEREVLEEALEWARSKGEPFWLVFYDKLQACVRTYLKAEGLA